jgi:hypothetical protein
VQRGTAVKSPSRTALEKLSEESEISLYADGVMQANGTQSHFVQFHLRPVAILTSPAKLTLNCEWSAH